MRLVLPRYVCASLASLTLVACGDRGDSARTIENRDPAITAALGAPITYDPDLATMNRANSAAAIPVQDGSLPTIESGPKAIATARDEALRLVGGVSMMRKAPEPAEVSDSLPPEAALTAGARAAAAPRVDEDCVKRVSYTMAWAGRMPPAFPVYPRGATQEAAGTDEAGCALRAVNFVTPAPVGEVMDFYFTRAVNAGFSVRHTLQAGDNVLSGANGQRSVAVHARRLSGGLTEVDLVTGG